MEIQFETEDGLICDFTPDFRVQQNTSDQTQVSWRLSDGRSPGNVGVLLYEFSDEGTIYTTTFNWGIM